MKTPNIKIYIATHRRRVEMAGDPGYVPIQGGKILSSEVFAPLGDDSGANISYLNPFFNENTILYWMFNNGHAKADFMGLAHYRRFFVAQSLCTVINGEAVAASADFTEVFDGTFSLVVGHPISFVNAKTDMVHTLASSYTGCHVGFDLFLARKTLEKTSPDYLAAFDFAMAGGQLVPYNMFVGRREILEEYVAWIFPILMQLNEQIPYKSYADPYQQRAIAFLSERLFTVWVIQNRDRIKIGYRHVSFNSKL